MTHEFLDGSYRQANLKNESDEYLAKREALRRAEIERMKVDEHVASLRRALPIGPAVDNDAFLEGRRISVPATRPRPSDSATCSRRRVARSSSTT